ncbi:MAG: hypothetical protein AUJ51_02605 [Elusimicrobia bacterium CG1_02_56_21]|nr:MAG: hypothetical protein AUJ51_02605 [Elusimicrobia bacterium CG1_02_56_21]
MLEKLEDGGRVVPGEETSPYERGLYLRHLFAYEWASSYLEPSYKALELGCGEGYGSALLARGAARLVATDSDPLAISHAAIKYAAPNLEFIRHEDGPLPFPDFSFDRVFSFQVIEHIPDDAAFASDAARVLRKGGMLILTTPNRRFRLKPGDEPWYKFHIREYSKDDLEQLLKPFFSSVKVDFINSPPDIFEMELKVARTARLIQKLDPLGLRDKVPYALKQLVFKLMGRAKASAGPVTADTSAFSFSGEEKCGLDLAAVCIK